MLCEFFYGIFTRILSAIEIQKHPFFSYANECIQTLSSSSCDTVYMYLKLSFSRSFQTLAETPCGISVLTVNYVKQCPTDAISWKMAAKRMNCESLIHNCLPNTKHRLNTKPVKFQYHCLINAWINATLEVCAFNRTIIGTLSVTKIQCSPFAILLLRS